MGMSPTQRDRWLKYGANVALSCLAAIALAVLATYAAERRPIRIDATAEGLYSLKPQTIKIIRDIQTPIRLVSLYTHSKPPSSPDEDQQAQQAIVPPDEAAQTVNDLLEEYANKGKNITVETIDPVTSPTKVDDLIEEVESKYGGEIKQYRDFVESFKGTIDQIRKIADPEAKAVESLSLPQDIDQALLQTLREAFVTVQGFPNGLDELEAALQRPLKQKPPDYKGAADAITENLGTLSTVLDAVVSNFNTLEKRGGLPPGVADYMKQSLPHYQQLKKLVDDTLAQGKKLGELKLDTLRSALRERNTILVMSDKEWRAINYDQVWQPAVRVGAAVMSDTPPRPRFAGEQQVTAAILSLGSGGVKPKIAFVRAGGPPLTQSLGLGGGDAPLSEAAARLGLYNFDVVEKDLTGQFAQQSGGEIPEPSDDEIKNATWVVWDFTRQQNPEMGGPTSIAPQVAQHLKDGGSAVIITSSRQDPMADTLADWGLTIRPDAMIVHEKIAVAGSASSDMLESALGLPFVFDLREYGDHPLAKPLNGLDGIFLGMCPVTVHEVKGCRGTPLLPIPTAPEAPRSWGAAGFDPNDQNAVVQFNSTTDIDGPLYAGAAVEKDTGQRLVVLAAGEFPNNQLLDLNEQEFNADAPPVLRCPGNGELFTNSVFWAAHQDTLIDISPAAMDVGRIREMTPAALNFWRVGVLLIGMPLLVLAIGAGVYVQRRD
jgi:ABC-type uncharacterized transport system